MSRLRNITLSAAQQISDTSELTGAASLAQVPGGGSASSAIFSIAYRRRFAQAPALSLSFARRGRVEGHVFEDDSGTGEYTTDKPPVAGAVVLLDDRRSTTSDASGHYSFDHVDGPPPSPRRFAQCCATVHVHFRLTTNGPHQQPRRFRYHVSPRQGLRSCGKRCRCRRATRRREAGGQWHVADRADR